MPNALNCRYSKDLKADIFSLYILESAHINCSLPPKISEVSSTGLGSSKQVSWALTKISSLVIIEPVALVCTCCLPIFAAITDGNAEND